MNDINDTAVLKGRYRVLGTLGRGAMGTVFLAHDAVMDRRVAIKVLRFPEGLSAEAREEAVKRFYREARLAGKLIHPNIIATFDIDRHGENHFISMELVEGETLAARLERGGALDPQAAARAALQVCLALEFAHDRGVVHRDIKPGNIFMIEGESVKVGDFGIARSMDSATLTQTGYSMGTPQYMSPEQVRGEALDPRSDLFSLGVVLYEMLVGANPFAADTPPTVIYNILEKEPPPLEGIEESAPALASILARALSKEVEGRYVNAGEMAEDLRALIDARQAAAPAGVMPVVEVATPAPQADRPAGKPRVVKGKRKKRVIVIAIAAAICISLAVALPLIFLLGGEERPDPTRTVQAFFDAMRDGNIDEAAALLTPKARQDLNLEPLQSKIAQAAKDTGRAELDFGEVETRGDFAAMEVWIRGNLVSVSLGLWRLTWVEDRWLIYSPGYIGEVVERSEDEGGD